MEKLTKAQESDNVLELERTIPAQKVKETFRDIYNELRKNAFIPGFRKGRVPDKVLRMKIGGEVIDREAVRILVEEDFPQMVAKHELWVVKEELLDSPIKEGEDFTYKMKIWVTPEFELPQYKGNTYQVAKIEVTDEEVEERVKRELEKYAKFKEVEEDAGVEKGDLVFIDFSGKKDGELIEGAQAENYPLEVGKGQFLPEFEENLIGLKKGEEKNFKLTFPENYQEKSLAGEEVDFWVKVLKIKRKEYPSWEDEEFLKKLKVNSKEEYYTKIRETILKEKEKAQKEEKINAVLADVLGKVEIKDLPERAINERAEELLRDFEMMLKRSGMSLEHYLAVTKTVPEMIVNHYKEKAKNEVKLSMVLQKIAEVEGIEVAEEEIFNRAKEALQGSKDEEVEEMLARNLKWRRILKEGLLADKVVDFLLENNTFEEVRREELEAKAKEEKEEEKEIDE